MVGIVYADEREADIMLKKINKRKANSMTIIPFDMTYISHR